jgi:hypothetical protein
MSLFSMESQMESPLPELRAQAQAMVLVTSANTHSVAHQTLPKSEDCPQVVRG